MLQLNKVNTKMTEYNKISLKFIVLNMLFLGVMFVFTPFFGIILGILQYSPSGSGKDYYWINPAISLLPLSYLIVSIIYLFKKNLFKFTFFLVLFIFFSSYFLKLYGEKQVISDFKILFHQKNK